MNAHKVFNYKARREIKAFSVWLFVEGENYAVMKLKHPDGKEDKDFVVVAGKFKEKDNLVEKRLTVEKEVCRLNLDLIK